MLLWGVLAFIDESGDAGLKLGLGSSPYFVVSLVVFADGIAAGRADQRINAIRSEMGFPSHYEFKFNSMRPEFRKRFLTSISQQSFSYFAIVINKRLITGEGFKYKESFYKFACSLVCNNAKDHLRDAKVVIDGSGSSDFRRQMSTYLCRKVNVYPTNGPRRIRGISIQDSRGNNIIQLADMVSGAIARHYSGKADAVEYRQIIRPREAYVQFWPRQK